MSNLIKFNAARGDIKMFWPSYRYGGKSHQKAKYIKSFVFGDSNTSKSDHLSCFVCGKKLTDKNRFANIGIVKDNDGNVVANYRWLFTCGDCKSPPDRNLVVTKGGF